MIIIIIRINYIKNYSSKKFVFSLVKWSVFHAVIAHAQIQRNWKVLANNGATTVCGKNVDDENCGKGRDYFYRVGCTRVAIITGGGDCLVREELVQAFGEFEASGNTETILAFHVGCLMLVFITFTDFNYFNLKSFRNHATLPIVINLKF